MDQPTYDGVNIYCVSRLHAIGLKVALSGLGADEIFGATPSSTRGACWREPKQPYRLLPHTLAAAVTSWLGPAMGSLP